MNTNTEIAVSPSSAKIDANIPYLEEGFAGVVVTIFVILLRAVLTDWLHDQQMQRELLKKVIGETKQ